MECPHCVKIWEVFNMSMAIETLTRFLLAKEKSMEFPVILTCLVDVRQMKN